MTGILLTPDRQSPNAVHATVTQAGAAYAACVSQVWLGQQLDLDATALAAVIGTRGSRHRGRNVGVAP